MTNTSSNVTPIESKQTAPGAKFTITATLDGFPIAIEAEGKASDLRALVDRLKSIGAEPPQIAPAQSEPTKKVAPVCPDHGTQMKASRKPGAYFCPRQAEDGGYCQHKA